jgi:osmotically-inducible protein OsmY
MTNRKILVLLAAPLVAGMLAGCVEMAVIGAGSAAVISANDRRTTGTQVEDESIELRALNRIGERFGDKVHINVTSYNRVVLLTGEAPDPSVKAEIEKLVLALPNVRGVNNEMQIGGVSSVGARSNDTFLTTKVKGRFATDGKFNIVHVKVVTEASAVYLLGLVTEGEANSAVEIARTTGGVKKVVKVFEYCKPADAICRPASAPQGEQAKPKPAS